MMITAIAETIVKLEEVDSVLLALLRESGDKRWSVWSDQLEDLIEALTREQCIRESEALRKLFKAAEQVNG
jgi:hypothetical protein